MIIHGIEMSEYDSTTIRIMGWVDGVSVPVVLDLSDTPVADLIDLSEAAHTIERHRTKGS